jgi:hypothetical protein
MDANDGEEIVNLAEEPGGLGDRAGAPNSPTAAEELRKGALSLPCSNECMRSRKLECTA